MDRTTKLPIIASILAIALGAAACHGGTASQRAQAGDLDLTVAVRPDPPVAGEDALELTIRDAGGKPVDGATVTFAYDMAAMGSMPEMTGGGDVAAEGGGRYRIGYTLPMLGDWTLSLAIAAPGHSPTDLVLRVSPPHRGFSLRSGAALAEPAIPMGSAGTAPMTNGSAGAAAVAEGKPFPLSAERQQLIGVTWATVDERPLVRTLRAPARIVVDERNLADVTLKYDAYVETLAVDYTGKSVAKGDPLLTLYSADLLAAQQELLQAARAPAAGGGELLLHAARERLKAWDLSDAQIEATIRGGKADGRVTIVSPASGVVLEKDVVAGTHVMAGTMLYRIGNLGKIWALADVYQIDAPYVAIGQPGTVTIPGRPGDRWSGRVSFVAPTVDEKTRTLQARIELSNGALALKPGMFATVEIAAPLGSRLAVPDRALLDSGEHRYAFVERAPGRLQAVEVTLGATAGDDDEVIAGLAKGDRVAVDATFLLSSEATLRDALPHWGKK